MNKRSFILVASAMLMIFLSIAALGVTTFIVSILSQSDARTTNTSCMYLAQAGLQASVFSYRFRDLSTTGYFPLGPFPVDPQHSFVLGGDADDLLMVDTASSALSGNGRNLLGLEIQNATNSQDIIIDRMIVTWFPANRRMRAIFINNIRVWRGNLRSPANANIRNFRLNSSPVPTKYPITRIRFNGSIADPNLTVNVQFVMTDGSIRDVDVYPASANFNFTVKSTGKVTGSSGYRSIKADYNAITGTVLNYAEIDEEVL